MQHANRSGKLHHVHRHRFLLPFYCSYRPFAFPLPNVSPSSKRRQLCSISNTRKVNNNSLLDFIIISVVPVSLRRKSTLSRQQFLYCVVVQAFQMTQKNPFTVNSVVSRDERQNINRLSD